MTSTAPLGRVGGSQPECPFLLMGTYKPKRYRGSLIGEYLTKFTERLGLVPLVDGVHGPQVTSIWCNEKLHAEVRRFAQHSQGSSWHQDGDLAPGSNMDHAAVLWAAVTPTEYNVGKEIFRPEPFEIVIARNLGCVHRSPPDAPHPPERRWFFRQRVELPTDIELP